MPEQVKIADAAAVPPGKVMRVEVNGRRLALCNVAGEFHLVDDVCTHDGGSLDQGELIGAEIQCPRHGARFDVRTGRVRRLPAIIPIKTYPVTVEDGAVLVDGAAIR
jgi:3-phenylpropionate/trans-cinnamate dioxygenase ferredoxin component